MHHSFPMPDRITADFTFVVRHQKYATPKKLKPYRLPPRHLGLFELPQRCFDLVDLDSAFEVILAKPDFALAFVVWVVLESAVLHCIENLLAGPIVELQDEQTAFGIGEFFVSRSGANGPAAEAGAVGLLFGH